MCSQCAFLFLRLAKAYRTNGSQPIDCGSPTYSLAASIHPQSLHVSHFGSQMCLCLVYLAFFLFLFPFPALAISTLQGFSRRAAPVAVKPQLRACPRPIVVSTSKIASAYCMQVGKQDRQSRISPVKKSYRGSFCSPQFPYVVHGMSALQQSCRDTSASHRAAPPSHPHLTAIVPYRACLWHSMRWN